MPKVADKQVRFERLAEKRITETIKKLRLVGNLANRNNYSYTDEHVRQILDVLESEMRTLRQRFKGQSKDDGAEFQFKRKKLERKGTG